MKKIVAKLFILCSLAILASGCSDLSESKKPIVLSMWHVYGGQTDSPMNRMVVRFNQSVGREKPANQNRRGGHDADYHSVLPLQYRGQAVWLSGRRIL
ncbi:hypothetical protein LJC36_02890 [Desulfovibrio sp. OttesenSCG-928-C14]|nr:hypothetical protein [Desulfovibrio sp. OttesenSCG-928-C14]